MGNLGHLIEELIEEYHPEWTSEAMKEGLKEGTEKGIVEGRRQEAVSLTIRQLTRKLGALYVDTGDHVRDLSLEDLEALGEALLDFSDYSDLESG